MKSPKRQRIANLPVDGVPVRTSCSPPRRIGCKTPEGPTA
jgi:hypothetical protein